MSWQPDHPGGIITCDVTGCMRTRRYYCTPAERDEWDASMVGASVRDLCPNHTVGSD